MFHYHIAPILTQAKWVSLTMLTAVLTACGGGSGTGSTVDAAGSGNNFEAMQNSQSASGPSAVSAKTQALQAEKDAELLANIVPGDRRLIVKFKPTDAGSNRLQTANAAGFELESLGFTLGDSLHIAASREEIKSLEISAKASGDSKGASVSAAAREGLRLHFVKINDNSLTLPAAIRKLQGSGLVEYAEPNYLYKTHAVPNDTFYAADLWHHNNTGQVINGVAGVAGAHISSQAAWNIRTSASNVVVAVIDDGVYWNHPDLASNMWVNPSEIVDGFDNDGDGIADNIYGADFRSATTTNSLPTGADPKSCKGDLSHGTWVAGSVGATGNNSLGVAGVAWQVKIMALNAHANSVANQQGNTAAGTACAPTGTGISGFSSISATAFAVAKKQAGVNLRVINMSYGGSSFSQAAKDSIIAAGNNGIVVVASAGNNNDNVVQYPAGYELPNLIAVGATDNKDVRSTFSTYGSWVHISAPGTQIGTTSGENGYRAVNGTSFSAPITSGAVALLLANEATLTPLQVKNRLKVTSDRIAGLLSANQMSGRLNLNALLINSTASQCSGLPGAVTTLNYGPEYIAGAKYLVAVQAIACPGLSVTATLNPGASATSLVMLDNGVYPDASAGDGVFSTSISLPTGMSGNVPVSFTSANATGSTVTPGSIFVSSAGQYAVSKLASYTWEEYDLATATRLTALEAADDGTLAVTAPFAVKLYGVSTSSLTIAGNGRICLAGALAQPALCQAYIAEPIPTGKNSLQKLGFIAPWWLDWNASTSSATKIWTMAVGTAPNRKFVVTWEDIAQIGSANTANGASFQAVFFENDSAAIQMNYKDTDVGDVLFNNGLKGSVGIQFHNGKIGTRQLYNQALLNNVTSQSSYMWRFNTSNFSDVIASDFYANSVESLLGSGITSGCGGGLYCPNSNVTRYQMAAFMMRASRGHDLIALPALPNPLTPSFNDVPASDPFYKYVEGMKQDGITLGCGNGAYCPQSVVTREQMAVFLVRAVRGSSFIPSAAIGQFPDVGAVGFYAPYIEELARMGITSGCGAGNYCPSQTVSRGQMALFMQRAFMPYGYNYEVAPEKRIR